MELPVAINFAVSQLHEADTDKNVRTNKVWDLTDEFLRENNQLPKSISSFKIHRFINSNKTATLHRSASATSAPLWR